MLKPSWWSDECEEDAGCVQLLCAYIASILGVSYSQIKALLEDGDIPLVLSPSAHISLKTNKEEEKVHATVAICEKLATVLSGGVSYIPSYQAYKHGDRDSRAVAQLVRDEILKDADVACVDFNSLLEYCWQKHIIVAHFVGFSGAKIDGAAIPQVKHPVIILGSAKKGAWSTFHLAHELGHIILGHKGSMFCSSISADEAEDNEREANAFALALLMGNGGNIPHLQLNSNPYTSRGVFVAWGRAHRVEPDSLILFVLNQYYGERMRVANKLLQDKMVPHEVVNARLRSALEEACFSDVEEEFVNLTLSYAG